MTLYSAERNLTPDGKPRIDLNQQDLRKLHQQLTAALGEEQAQFMILYRQFGPSTAEPTPPSPAPARDRPRRSRRCDSISACPAR